MNFFLFGDTISLNLLLEDGSSSMFPRVFVYQNAVLETTVDLTHVAQGRYTGNWTPLLSSNYQLVYIVYSNAGHTIISPMYTRTLENWKAFDFMIDGIWDELLAGHTIPGSTGDALNRIPVLPASSRERVVQGYAYKSGVLIGNLWLEKDGQLVTGVTSAVVDFYSDTGTFLFQVTDAAPDAQGLFQVSKPSPGFTGDELVYARAAITIPGPRTITTVKAISTVS